MMLFMSDRKISDKLKTFLETNVLKTKIVSIKTLNRGGVSLNYKISTDQHSYLLKIFNGSKIKRAERFLLIYQNIADVENLSAPNLSFNCFFSFDDHILFLMDFVEGRKLEPSDLTPSVLSQISDNYKTFLSAHFDDNRFIRDKLSPENLFLKTKQNLDNLASGSFFCFYHTKILSVLHKIYQSLPNLEQNPVVIHGDTGPNNFILNKKGKLFFLDFEMVRYGYLSEDLIQFILSLLLQHRIWFFDKQKFIESVRFFNDAFKLSRKEWIYGICLYFLRLAERRSKTKILRFPRKSWLFYKHLQKFDKVMSVLLDCF